MLILGVDPGSRFTGWGLIEQAGTQTKWVDSGTLKLGEKKPLEERLVVLANGLEKVLSTHQPQTAAIEQIFTARNARSALVLGHARGVILLTLRRAGLDLYEYTPTQVKQATTGVGRADKTQVGKMVALLLGHRAPMGEDESDALAVALTHGAFMAGSGLLKGGA